MYLSLLKEYELTYSGDAEVVPFWLWLYVFAWCCILKYKVFTKSMSCTVNPFRGLAYCIGFAYVFDFAKRILGDVFRPGMRKLWRIGWLWPYVFAWCGFHNLQPENCACNVPRPALLALFLVFFSFGSPSVLKALASFTFWADSKFSIAVWESRCVFGKIPIIPFYVCQPVGCCLLNT